MKFTLLASLVLLSLGTSAFSQEYLGRLNANPYAPDSTANANGPYGSLYSPTSINNPNGQFGSPYSPTSANNAYTTTAPSIVAPDGTYLGQVSANPYSPDSTANPYGPYGSPYSPSSVNNPYGQYGSPYSSNSANNPYAVDTPVIVSP